MYFKELTAQERMLTSKVTLAKIDQYHYNSIMAIVITFY